MSQKTLPPLEVGTAYEATDFERFDYVGSSLTGAGAILRLHLRNGTTLDLPSSEEELTRLMRVLCDAFGPEAVAHLKGRGWV